MADAMTRQEAEKALANAQDAYVLAALRKAHMFDLIAAAGESLTALITAARAAGAAAERERECAWVPFVSTYDGEERARGLRSPCVHREFATHERVCPDCGGSVRVVAQEGQG